MLKYSFKSWSKENNWFYYLISFILKMLIISVQTKKFQKKITLLLRNHSNLFFELWKKINIFSLFSYNLPKQKTIYLKYFTGKTLASSIIASRVENDDEDEYSIKSELFINPFFVRSLLVESNNIGLHFQIRRKNKAVI